MIYADWLLKRREQYAANASIGGVAFQDAWGRRLEARYRKTRFGAFAPGASADAHGDMLKVRRAMRWARGLWGRGAGGVQWSKGGVRFARSRDANVSLQPAACGQNS